MFLADGHHRYEAALRYSRGQTGEKPADHEAASNYVMMTLVEFDDPGLLLLPYHRVAGGMTEGQLAAVRSRMDELFESRPLRPDVTPGEAVHEVARSGENGHCFGVFWRDSPPTLHTLRAGVDWEGWGQLAVSEAWVLQERVLGPALGDALGECISTTVLTTMRSCSRSTWVSSRWPSCSSLSRWNRSGRSSARATGCRPNRHFSTLSCPPAW